MPPWSYRNGNHLPRHVTDSSGEPVPVMLQKYWRPMALSRRGSELWFGFVINDSSVESISPGQTVQCTVSFLNHEDAQHIFPAGASILFGDGIITKGVLKLLQDPRDACLTTRLQSDS
ncbi:hypothetical protein BIY45_14845 [Stenotrophomonas sp. BIIR7]|nr:hypothetical protein BIY45_14845 [Stenotrophomonas sp. BIIR7]